MYYADRLGLDSVRERLLYYKGQLSDATLETADLVDRLAESGETFLASAGN
jgi:hypothetical protein